jgi:NADPH-dependent glutamate synthase beta subunit-like oxidoreductase
MPAIRAGIDEALAEGVQFEFQTIPNRILAREGHVFGVAFIRTKPGLPDKSGREIPLPIASSEFEVSADLVISAIGEQADLRFLGSSSDLPVRFNGESANPKVFACGDIANSKGTVTQAIASGRRVAETVAERLTGRRSI